MELPAGNKNAVPFVHVNYTDFLLQTFFFFLNLQIPSVPNNLYILKYNKHNYHIK